MNRFFYIVSILLVLSACNDRADETAASNEIIVDSLPAECPYLSKDAKGNPVLSWVRMLNDSTTSFCYVFFKDGKTTAPVSIPNTSNIQPHGENLPKIIFKPSGEIIALWGISNANPNNKYSGLVYYVQSFDDGKTWSNPRSLTTDTASYDQRYYDVALLPNGEAGITWLDNRKTISSEGSGLYFAATDGKNGFANERLISQPCCQCCRTDLYIDHKGYIHTIYRAIIQDSIRDMVHVVSTDNGKTFSSPGRISKDNWVINACPHTGPTIAETTQGLHFAWFTGGINKGCFYASSFDNGNSFSPRSSISESGSHPQMTSLPDGQVIVVWDENIQAGDKYYRKIGMQKRNEETILNNRFITPDTSIASYPVIEPFAEGKVLVAYSKKKGSKNYVAYQEIRY